jgi:hypothetical protein
LVGEHALLLRGVQRRVWPVLALIDAGTWPAAELRTLVAFLRTSLLRQVSDEEALLFPGGAGTAFAELTAQHARLHALTEGLAQTNLSPCPLPELRRTVAELANLLAGHLATEQALLAGLVEAGQPVPSAAQLVSGAQTWLPPDNASLLIVLDDLPSEYAAQLCIERLLRLRPGQRAEIRSTDPCGLEHVYRWMRAFDPAGYGIEYVSVDDPVDTHLQVTRRRTR